MVVFMFTGIPLLMSTLTRGNNTPGWTVRERAAEMVVMFGDALWQAVMFSAIFTVGVAGCAALGAAAGTALNDRTAARGRSRGRNRHHVD